MMQPRADRPSWITATLAGGIVALGMSWANASDLVEIQPLTDRVVMLHFNDGHVQHHQRGQPRSEEKVFVDPLDVDAGSRATSYTITSPDDPAYRAATAPLSVYRKSKGTDFAWFVDKWENGRAVNTRPDHTKEHWLYLGLPTAMQPGRTYTVNTGTLAKNGGEWALPFDTTKARSEAVHVNTLGYVPDAPQKYAYIYHWMGDGGSLDLKAYEGRAFHLVETSSGADMFHGPLRSRMSKENAETAHKSDSPPYGNFLGADVWECDFSSFCRPGTYVVAVEGVGCSWPFRIDPDVYRSAFVTVARALYHNRSGIALRQPYTEFERPAPHHPQLTPGFAGKLRYTRVRWPEWGSEGGDARKLLADSPGPLEDTWGWYQDAGDWDSYYTHLRVAQELLLVYEMGPGKFHDAELKIPESGNGVPDILDEAAWLPRFCQRLRAELMAKGWGTGGVGLRVAGDAFGSDEGTTADGKKVGRGSWEDTNRIWMVSGEDPWSTYRYAGTAAHLAYAYQLAGVKRDPNGIDWEKEAREAYAWAQANTRKTDETAMGSSLRHPRAYAAACLFRLTGDGSYESQLAADTQWVKADTKLTDEAAYGPFVYALGGGRREPRAELLQRLRSATLTTADQVLLSSSAQRALRWGGDFYMPMLVGQQTTPLVLPGAVAYTLTRSSEPDRARRYLAALYTTCDYFLGGNSLNQTWVTGLGPRYPTQIFHLDAWYNGKGRFHPGLIPYSPWRKDQQQGAGPWDHAWAYQTLHPSIDAWPGNERWFSNRCSPVGSEFTIHQNIGPAAAIFGFLCDDKRDRAGISSGAPAVQVVEDPRVRRYVIPRRVVWQSSGATVENAQALLAAGRGQVTLDNGSPCVLHEGGGVLVDFGRELQGGVQIMVGRMKDQTPARLRVRFGESVSEAMSNIGGAKNATNDHAVRDQSVLTPWLGTLEIGNTGFRFVRLDLEDKGRSVPLVGLRAVSLLRDLEYRGSFRCSDERLNRIWQTGAYTVHLNMQDYLWDGIKRDRLVWIGDMHPETRTILSVFGAHDIIPRSLDLVRDETPLPKWMNGISSYSMWWVLIQREWYRYTADRAYLGQQRDYLVPLLQQLCKCIDAKGREKLPEGRFLDWPSQADKQATHAGLHALLIQTLDAGAELCEVLTEPDQARQCRDTAARLRQYVPDPGPSKQAAALMALAGLRDARQLNEQVLAVGGAARMSTFYGYYVLQARAQAGDIQGCLDCIRQYWGGMLDLGATTFWEDFDLAWTENAARIDELVPEGKKDIHGDFGNYCYKGFRHSLCHGWASGPTAWLSEHVLGVSILEPGGTKVRIEPHLGDLAWAQGTFPLRQGLIRVRHVRQADGSVKSEVTAPQGVEVVR